MLDRLNFDGLTCLACGTHRQARCVTIGEQSRKMLSVEVNALASNRLFYIKALHYNCPTLLTDFFSIPLKVRTSHD